MEDTCTISLHHGKCSAETRGTARLEIKTKDGGLFSEFIDTPKGDPTYNPMSKDEILAKFRDNVASSQTLSSNNAENALELLINLEEFDNVKRITKLLVA